MCLREVYSEPKVKLNKKGEGVGYKVFSQRRGRLYSICQGVNKAIPIGRWVNEMDYRQKYDVKKRKIYDGKYPFGFHVILNKADTGRWYGVVRNVKFRDVVAIGKQNPIYDAGDTAVAREIFVIRKRRYE